jgi:ribose/xylose/arabinose/galactoside ABC-type transport system permease subunit
MKQDNAIRARLRAISYDNLQQFIVLGILVLFVLIMIFVSGDFLSFYNINAVFKQTAFAAITGCAALLLIASGNIDISVGSVMAVSCVVFAYACKFGLNIWEAAIVSMLVGAVVGLINAVITVNFKIPSIIATLVTMTVFRGVAYSICNATPVAVPNSVTNFDFIGNGFIAGFIVIPLALIIIVAAIFIFLEQKSLLGKYALAIGSNKTAAILSGINVDRVQTILFILTGAMAGLSGAVMASTIAVGDPTVGQGFEFSVMIAVILGGANINGGEGTVTGTLIGAFIVGVLNNGMNLLGIQSFYQYVVSGVILLLAIIFSQLMRNRLNRA